ACDVLALRNLERIEAAAFDLIAPVREERPRDLQDLIDGHAGPDAAVLADVRGALPDLDRGAIVPARGAQNPAFPARQPPHPHQYLDRGGLAGTVPSEEAVHRAARHVQIETGERLRRVVALRQPAGLDDEIGDAHDFLVRGRSASRSSSASNSRRISSDVSPAAVSRSRAACSTGCAVFPRATLPARPFSLTNAPDPCRSSMTPSSSSARYALATVLGWITRSSATRRMAGR